MARSLEVKKAREKFSVFDEEILGKSSTGLVAELRLDEEDLKKVKQSEEEADIPDYAKKKRRRIYQEPDPQLCPHCGKQI